MKKWMSFFMLVIYSNAHAGLLTDVVVDDAKSTAAASQAALAAKAASKAELAAKATREEYEFRRLAAFYTGSDLDMKIDRLIVGNGGPLRAVAGIAGLGLVVGTGFFALVCDWIEGKNYCASPAKLDSLSESDSAKSYNGTGTKGVASAPVGATILTEDGARVAVAGK